MNEILLNQLKNNPLVKTDKINREDKLLEMDNIHNIMSKLVFPKDDPTEIHTDEIKCRLTYLARKYGIAKDPIIINATNDLNRFCKEMSIYKSGQIGETTLSIFVEKSQRPNTYSFKNITLHDKQTSEQTEIDHLILTDDGLIILEAKRIKDNITLDQKGHLVHANGECFDRDKSVVSKIELKKTLLERKLNELGIDFDYKISTCLVLVTPPGKSLYYKNLHGRQQIKLVNQIPKLIENFSSYYPLKNEQKDRLLDAISCLETNKKKDFINFEYSQMISNFEKAILLLEKKQLEEDEIISSNQEIRAKRIKKQNCSRLIPSMGLLHAAACALGLGFVILPGLLKK